MIGQLEYESTYYWRINAWNEAGNGPWSAVNSFKIPKYVSVNEDKSQSFDSKISPLRDAASLKDAEIKKLIASIKKIIAQAIELGGSSISDYVNAKGDLGYFQNSHKVYAREKQNCLLCKNLIKKIKQNGRSSFYCPQCQH